MLVLMEENRPAKVGHGKVKAAGDKGKGGKSQGDKSLRSFVLRTYIVGGMGVKELHIN